MVQLGLEAFFKLVRLVFDGLEVSRRSGVGGVVLLDEPRAELVLGAIGAVQALGRVDLAVAEPPVHAAAAVVWITVHPREEVFARFRVGFVLRVLVPARGGVDGFHRLGPVCGVPDPLAVVVLRPVGIAVLLDVRDVLEAVVDPVRAELWRIGAHRLAPLGIVAHPPDPRIGVGHLSILGTLLLHDSEQVFTSLLVIRALRRHAHAARVAVRALNLAPTALEVGLEFLLPASHHVGLN
mmetsp:Transcript_3490/g.15939  ORF Transcript_3490/g.15939 Transcript_3490/m.15939 type:complete len:238 (+) Transcript_3490:1374-2087(+)